MLCPNCNHEVSEDARFCPQCGQTLAEFDDLDSPTIVSPPPDRQTAPASTSGQSSASTSTGSGVSRLVSSPSGDGFFEMGSVLAERYRVIGRLGSGGMGDVYRADDLKLDQSVALKFLPTKLAQNADRLARLFAEVRLARQVAHPNVCRVYDIAEHEGVHFLSMEFIDGEDLGSLLRRIGKLSEDKAGELARQVCAGLHAAHERGILHRDLKPANILIDNEGVAHIADFGLAGIDSEIDQREIRAGTPGYMSPEQLAGTEVSSRSDIYALGLILYEMFTGHAAFSARSIAELSEQQSMVSSRSSADLSSLDPTIERAILRCLDPDPSQRPPSALALAAALPGGDPVAAALAAGEVPSPEMIAASGSAGVLSRAWGVAALLSIILSFAFIHLLAPRTALHELAPMDTPSEVLIDRAEQLRRSFGYPDSAVTDQVSGWYRVGATLRHELETRPKSPAWDSLSVGQPASIVMWVRESPAPLAATNLIGRVGTRNPPLTRPGMTLVAMNPRGNLNWFAAVPPTEEPTTEVANEGEIAAGDSVSVETSTADPRSLDVSSNGASVDWTAMFSAAALDPADFEPIAKNWNPPHYADEIRTFRGHYRDRPSLPIEIRMAGYAGRPTWFSIREPWQLDEEERASNDRGVQAAQWIMNSLIVLLIVSAALLARRNVRSGLGDRRGARTISTFLGVCMTLSFVSTGHHVPEFQTEWALFNVVTGLGLFMAALTWIIYMALEPFARVVWPEIMISWSRLLQGRWRDPRVGRDLLLGLALGSLMGVGETLIFQIAPALGHPFRPIGFDPNMLRGAFPALGALFTTIMNGAWVPMALLLFAIGIWALVRKKNLATVITALILVSVIGLAADNPLQKFGASLAMLTFVATLFRLGLVSSMAYFFAITIFDDVPFTPDLGKWYASNAIGVALFVIGLAVLAFRISQSTGASALRSSSRAPGNS